MVKIRYELSLTLNVKGGKFREMSNPQDSQFKILYAEVFSGRNVLSLMQTEQNYGGSPQPTYRKVQIDILCNTACGGYKIWKV